MFSVQDVAAWADELAVFTNRIGSQFKRSEIRSRAAIYLKGLLASVERKNGWQLAEFAGDETLKNFQHFIARATWSADAVRDGLSAYVVEVDLPTNGGRWVKPLSFPVRRASHVNESSYFHSRVQA